MFKEFKVKDIFELVVGKQPVEKDRFENPADNLVPAITGVTVNNGTGFYTTKEGKKTYSNILTISKDGEYAGTVYLQDREVYLAGHSMGLIPKTEIDNDCLIYIASLFINYLRIGYWKINAQIPSVTDTKMDGVVIRLPVIESSEADHEYTVDDIDWQYMRDRITELERDRITELDAYLQATGLNDYELTEEDVRYGKFVIGEIFNSQNGNNNLRKADVTGKGVHIITAGVKNNGILGLSDKRAKVINANTITVDLFGNTYFRDFNYKMTRSVFSLELKEGALSEGAGLYICSELKQLAELFNYENSCSFNKIKSLSIELPIKSDGTPDFDYMERYIRAMEKVVIADVVKYKDKVIETTKKVVGE